MRLHYTPSTLRELILTCVSPLLLYGNPSLLTILPPLSRHNLLPCLLWVKWPPPLLEKNPPGGTLFFQWTMESVGVWSLVRFSSEMLLDKLNLIFFNPKNLIFIGIGRKLIFLKFSLLVNFQSRVGDWNFKFFSFLPPSFRTFLFSFSFFLNSLPFSAQTLLFSILFLFFTCQVDANLALDTAPCLSLYRLLLPQAPRIF